MISSIQSFRSILVEEYRGEENQILKKEEEIKNINRKSKRQIPIDRQIHSRKASRSREEEEEEEQQSEETSTTSNVPTNQWVDR